MDGTGIERVTATRNHFGERLRAWRNARGMSQLSLSMSTGVSARHLSCLETGRAMPSRDMVLTLAQALDVPLRDRNALLEAAGFAALYRETLLDAGNMTPVRDAIAFMLGATEPNPTFVVNRRYDVLSANETGRWILETFTHALGSFQEPYNFGRLLVAENGMRRHIANWADVARKVLGRLRRDVGGEHARDAIDEALLAEVLPAFAELGPPTASSDPLPLMVPLHLHTNGIELRFFTTIATLGTPLDVTLQELRIETLFPADAESKRVLVSRRS